MKKIFFIGFNKIATTSIHHFFDQQQYKSYHWKIEENNRDIFLAQKIVENFNTGKKLLDGIDDAIVYSDIFHHDNTTIYDAHNYFRYLDEQYPNSYFILQVRNVSKWIKSRLNHGNGLYAEQYMKLKNITDKEDLIKLWRQEFSEHSKNVNDHFKNNEKFMVFNIEKDNSIDELIEFLSPSFNLNNSFWSKHNRTMS